jgi:hypothetical protein
MPRFEQQITDEQVAAARKKIEAGASLRSAAAEVPCAPSTLSDRIKKAEAAELEAVDRAGIRRGGRYQARRARKKLSDADDFMGPVEVLRGALSAMRANGEPDWPTRVTAARALAQLRPELVQPTQEEQPSIVVYDLHSGAVPVLHRPQPVSENESAHEPAPAEPKLPLQPGVYIFSAGDRMFHLAEVDVGADEVVSLRFVKSRDGARDVFRAIGGNLEHLEAFFEADFEAGTGAETT